MFQRDYILRLIEQLAKTMGAVVTLRKAKQYQQAKEVIAEAAKNLVGLDLRMLLALPLDHIVTLVSPGGSLDAGKCLVVAELLQEDGEIKRLQGDDSGAFHSSMRALGLYLEVTGHEGLERIPDGERYLEAIVSLLHALAPYGALPDIQKRLVLHYERQGAYAHAEDLLFDLIDAGHTELVAPGIELYERLLDKSDDDLERGKLPRDEVEEGLAQLKAI